MKNMILKDTWYLYKIKAGKLKKKASIMSDNMKSTKDIFHHHMALIFKSEAETYFTLFFQVSYNQVTLWIYVCKYVLYIMVTK